MPSGLLAKLRPLGPWRLGTPSGERDRGDDILHSDTLYAALCSAMDSLGMLKPWLDATARASRPAVRLSSCFPFSGATLYVTPPRTMWPPQASSPQASTKVRWKGARFVPVSVVADLAAGRTPADHSWMIDVASQCLVAQSKSGPFRSGVRSAAAVDRLGEGTVSHAAACLEFSSDSGLWCAIEFDSPEAEAEWRGRVEGAFRLLGDSGVGGGRSRGWGHFVPEFAALPSLLRSSDTVAGYWILSVFSPAASDAVDWSAGSYSICTRSGRASSGSLKQASRMVSEGSVLVAASAPTGSVIDVAPEGSAHPVYRSGFAFSVPIPGGAA